jgi:hypothetical protein
LSQEIIHAVLKKIPCREKVGALSATPLKCTRTHHFVLVICKQLQRATTAGIGMSSVPQLMDFGTQHVEKR